MSSSFWKNLKKPFFVLAPMADVTNFPFRQILAKYARPDVFFNEFVSSDGLAHPEGRQRLMIDLKFQDDDFITSGDCRERVNCHDFTSGLEGDASPLISQRPIVAQFFTGTPENMEKSAQLAKELGFDGIDINMGCPDKSIEKQGAGAACIKDPKKAQALVYAAMKGAGGLPVSVKTRIGFNKIEYETWLPHIFETKPAALTVHLRTRKEMSKVPAHWEVMPEIVKLRDQLSPDTLVIGNGDVFSKSDGRHKVKMTSCDGVMIGRGVFSNFFIFADKEPTLKQRYEIAIEHTKIWKASLEGQRPFDPMKKFYKMYLNGFDGASAVREQVFKSINADQAIDILETKLKSL